MKLERTAKIDGENLAKIWIDGNLNRPIVHITFSALHKVFVLFEVDNALMMYLIAGQKGRLRGEILENINKFQISDDHSEGKMELVLHLN